MPNDCDVDIHIMCDENDDGWIVTASDGSDVVQVTALSMWTAVAAACRQLEQRQKTRARAR